MCCVVELGALLYTILHSPSAFFCLIPVTVPLALRDCGPLGHLGQVRPSFTH